MHKIDVDIRPHSPVVASQLSANQQVERWFEANDFHEMFDSDRQIWKLHLDRYEIPAPNTAHSLVWGVSIYLSSSVNAKMLTDFGVLHREQDARLLAIIDDYVINMRMKPKKFEEASQDVLKQRVGEFLPLLKKQMANSRLFEIKRQLIEAWVEKISSFPET